MTNLAKPAAQFTDASPSSAVGNCMTSPVAIIGVSGRYPKAPDLERLWANLCAGVDAISEAKGDRWDLGHIVVGSDNPERIYTPCGGFLDRIDQFDAEFFGMSPREAKQVDPQHRLMLELTWEALESAGIVPANAAGSQSGVFIGISQNDYSSLSLGGDAPDAYTNIGSAISIAANRISYVFDFHGPSMSIDTACSSSMVAIHQACSALARGEIGMAVAGGVNMLISARPFAGFARASMLSPDGRCKSFDADGKGYVRAEGGGVLILKRLDEAERDGDPILAVIRATAVNSDGRTMGLALPNGAAQEALLRQIYAASGTAPEDVFYVEAHGTGTAAGDPIECGAIGRVLGAPRGDGSKLRIGSVKSNIGHLESGAGIAGITKVLLSIKNRQIPANLHFNTPNPKIEFDNWNLSVVDSHTPLPQSDKPLTFGVNSFGFGGTNGHMVLQEYGRPAAAPAAAASVEGDFLILSAHNQAALEALVDDYIALLDGADEAAWATIRSASLRLRSLHPLRLAISASDAAQATERLKAWRAGQMQVEVVSRKTTATVAAGSQKLAFVFSGNGPQWWGMGRELLAQSPAYRAAIEEVDSHFAPLAGWSLIERMGRDEAQTDITLTEVAQPMLFAQQVALTKILGAAGIQPAAVFGHSVGEAAAAWASGALSLEQATRVIYQRSQQQAKTRGAGKMAAVGISADDAAQTIAALGLSLEVAANNAPRAATVAGSEEDLKTLEAYLTEKGEFVRILALDYAFHTSAMDPIKAPLLDALAGLEAGPATVPMVSTVTAKVLEGPELAANYWWDNIRQPVAFDAAARLVMEELGITTFLEVGPHPVLKDYVLQVAKGAGQAGVIAMNTLRRPSSRAAAPELPTLRACVAEVYAAGAGQPARLFPVADRRLALPAFPWQRQRHWRGFNDLPDAVQYCLRDHGLLGARTPGQDGVWTNTMQTRLQPHLLDHVVQDAAIFPAAGYIEMMLAAGRLQTGASQLALENFEILRPLVLTDSIEPIVQTSVDSADGTFAIRSHADKASTDWTLHAKGRVCAPEGLNPAPLVLDALRAALPHHVSLADHYAECVARGLNYGPTFQGVTGVSLSAPDAARREALGTIDLAISSEELAAHHAHPALVDGCLQVLIALIAQNDRRACATIPVFVERILSFADVPAQVVCHAQLVRESDRSGVADLTIADIDGRIVMQLLGARFQKVEFNPAVQTLISEDWRVDHSWPVSAQAPLALPPVEEIAAGLVAAPQEAVLTEALERLAGAYTAAALADLAADEDSFTIASLALAGEVAEDQRPLLRALVAMAEADGFVTREEGAGRWEMTNAARPDAGSLLRELMLAHPAWVAELVALSAAGTGLVARLRGEVEARVSMAEILEDGAPSRAPAHRAMVDFISGLVAKWPQGRPIRVLDTTGGTAGLAAAILPILPPERSDYLFVEADEGLVARATHRLGQHHYFRADQPEVAQAYSFDIVLATDHSETGHLGRYLVSGGLILALHRLPARVWTLIHGAHEAEVQPLDPAMTERTIALAQTGPLGAELVVTKCQGTGGLNVAPDGEALARTLIVTQAEAEAPFVQALLEAMPQARLRIIAAADLSDEAMDALIAEESAGEYLHLAGWARSGDLSDSAAMLTYEDLRCYSLVALVRAIEKRAMDHPDAATPRLRIITRGGLASMASGPRDPFQATAIGFGRVLANEHPGLKSQTIDVHAKPDDRAAALDLVRALHISDDEAEVQLAGGQRLVNRVRKCSHADLAVASGHASQTEGFRLEVQAGGGLDSLALAPLVRRAPESDEVEVRVHAAGLNFRDVLWAMGMLPEEAVEHGFSGATIGMECAGVVERVGADVTHVKLGDRVMGFASSTFASHVTMRGDGVGHLPDAVSFNEGATIPTTFITAWYALNELARLKMGETILIHGAAGGVGLAALQIAKLKGAVVFATAGAADKQRLVRDMGADYVLSSRSLAFAEQIMEATGGKGIDVVLNSLAGEAITRGLNLLKPFGRFLEIGKRDLYANSRIGLRPFRQNLSYFGIDADTLLIERPELAAQLFAEVSAMMESGALRPLPHQTFPVERAGEAFRLMQASRHIGKIVITVPETARNVADVSRPLVSDGTWVVTGGLAGFGLSTAKWLAERGVKHLALMGRRGTATEEAGDALEWFAAQGVSVKALAVDVADRAALDAALQDVRKDMPPIRGVLHAAAVIEDAPIIMIQPELAHRVQNAKMQGAWNLHELTLDDPLSAFVMYSSSSAVVGNPGQAIYVGANLFLDALAQVRRAQGRPALAVGWGAIKGAGFLTRNLHVEDMLASRAGMGATPFGEALAELGRMLSVDATRVAASQFNLMRLGQSLPATRRPRFVKLVPQGVSVAGGDGGELAAALAAMSEDERSEALIALVREQVAQVIGAAVSQIETDKTLAEMGLDSLMAVELAEALEQQIGKPVSVMQMIQAGTVHGVVAVVQRGFRGKDEAAPAPVSASVADAA